MIIKTITKVNIIVKWLRNELIKLKNVIMNNDNYDNE